MTSIATKARAVAMNCEAKKHAYRQVQDGVVVSFVLHPQEVPDGLAIAPLGTRYMLAFVEVDENEQPKGGGATEQTQRLDKAPDPAPPPDRARKSWNEMSMAAQAGTLCSDGSFRQFLADDLNVPVALVTETVAAEDVRARCLVDTRADIKPGTEAGEHWRNLVSDYRAWQREPEVVG